MRVPDESMRAWRHRGDPLADEAVAAVHTARSAHDAHARPDALMAVRALARAGEPACTRFLAATSSLPAFYDAAALAPGRRVALRHAPVTFLVLLAGSLVESFAVAEGAAVLVRTGRLERDTRRRVYETATLVRALLLAGEERPGGIAHEALLRVRLLHALVRTWVSRSRGFDVEQLGLPVNQMDMLHTLLVFSHVLVRGLGTLGVALTEDERASWCALWRLAGHVLGVDPALAFTDVASERAAYLRVRAHYAPDDASRALAHAVLGELAGAPPFFLPKRALASVARTLLEDAGFTGAEDDHVADAFGLAPSRAWRASTALVARAVHGSDVLLRALPGGARAGALAGRGFIELNRWRVLRTMAPADFGFRTS